MLEDRPLDPDFHDRMAFSCGVTALDDYMRRYAHQHRRKGIARVYVLADSRAPAAILGYYSLSAAEVGADRLADADRRSLPRFPVPCFRMGRLAVHADRQGSGLGKLLLGCAVDRCLKAKREVAAYALIVDAKDMAARKFYERFGFKPLGDAALSLYLPLGRVPE